MSWGTWGICESSIDLKQVGVDGSRMQSLKLHDPYFVIVPYLGNYIMSSDSPWKRFYSDTLFPRDISHICLCRALFDQAAMSTSIIVFRPVS